MIDNDLEQLKSLRGTNGNLHIPNSLGFSSIELAKLLGRTDCLDILDPKEPPRIKVALPDELATTDLTFEDVSTVFGFEFTPTLFFTDYRRFTEVLGNCPWTLKSTPLGDEHRELAKTCHDEIWHGKTADVSVRWIHERVGFGLFAEGDLDDGEVIGNYTGEVRPYIDPDPEKNAYAFHYPTRLFSWNRYMVDARERGNLLRFVNHSDRPNLRPVCALDRNLIHLLFVTQREIPAGSHLTLNYGNDYWRQRDKISM